MDRFIYGNFFDLTSDIYLDTVKVEVASPDGYKVTFLVGKTQPFEEMFDVYCCRQCVSRHQMQFSFNGFELSTIQTPLEVTKSSTVKIKATLKK